MKCSFQGQNVKIMGKALQSLMKYGPNLYLEADENRLSLKTFNSSQSAMVVYNFNRMFFQTFELTAKPNLLSSRSSATSMPQQDNEDRGESTKRRKRRHDYDDPNKDDSNNDLYNGVNSCKVSMRSLQTAFKPPKKVECCEMSLLADIDKLQFRFYCKSDLVKNTMITILSTQSVSTKIMRNGNNNLILSTCKLFQNIARNFNLNEVELTFDISKDVIKVSNYIEGSRVNEKFLRSQMKVGADEFLDYRVEEETTVTFSFKEFKAFVNFGEILNADITMNYSQAGEPIIMGIDYNEMIDCSLIMSTLDPDDISFHEDLQENNTSLITTDIHQEFRSKKSTIEEGMPQPKFMINAEMCSNIDDFNIDIAATERESTIFSANKQSQRKNQCTNNLTSDDILMDNDDDMLLLEAVSQCEEILSQQNIANERTMESRAGTAKLDNEQRQKQLGIPETDDVIPQSPQHHDYVKRIFRRCFDKTYIPTETIPGDTNFYILDSDDDDGK